MDRQLLVGQCKCCVSDHTLSSNPLSLPTSSSIVLSNPAVFNQFGPSRRLIVSMLSTIGRRVWATSYKLQRPTSLRSYRVRAALETITSGHVTCPSQCSRRRQRCRYVAIAIRSWDGRTAIWIADVQRCSKKTLCS